MDLTPYLESLRQELRASAAPAGEDAARTAELLGNALDSAARLCLLEALSDAAAEITSKLGSASVEVRLRGREAEFVVTEQSPEPAAAPHATKIPEGGDTARITLRLPEQLKELIENASSTTGASVNSWLVHAVAGALNGMPPAPPSPPPFPPPHGRGKGRRMTGYAQA